MAGKNVIEVAARVVEALPGALLYRVALPGGQEIVAHTAGKMRLGFIRILPGDKVMLEMSPYDLTRGRITFRQR